MRNQTYRKGHIRCLKSSTPLFSGTSHYYILQYVREHHEKSISHVLSFHSGGIWAILTDFCSDGRSRFCHRRVVSVWGLYLHPRHQLQSGVETQYSLYQVQLKPGLGNLQGFPTRCRSVLERHL
jgi:hypothetical protein